MTVNTSNNLYLTINKYIKTTYISQRRNTIMKSIIVKNSTYSNILNDAVLHGLQRHGLQSTVTTNTGGFILGEILTVYPEFPKMKNEYVRATIKGVKAYSSPEEIEDIRNIAVHQLGNSECYTYNIELIRSRSKFLLDEFLLEINKNPELHQLRVDNITTCNNLLNTAMSSTSWVLSIKLNNHYCNVVPNGIDSDISDEVMRHNAVYSIFSNRTGRLKSKMLISEPKHYENLTSCKELLAVPVPEGYRSLSEMIINDEIKSEELNIILQDLGDELYKFHTTITDLSPSERKLFPDDSNQYSALSRALAILETDSDIREEVLKDTARMNIKSHKDLVQRLIKTAPTTNVLTHGNFILDNILIKRTSIGLTTGKKSNKTLCGSTERKINENRFCLVGLHNASLSTCAVDLLKLKESFNTYSVKLNPQQAMEHFYKGYTANNRRANSKSLDEDIKWFQIVDNIIDY